MLVDTLVSIKFLEVPKSARKCFLLKLVGLFQWNLGGSEESNRREDE